MDRAGGSGRAGKVTSMRSKREARIQAPSAKRGFARRDGARHAVAQAVEQRTVGLALIGLMLPSVFSSSLTEALFAQRGHAHGFERGFVGGARNGAKSLAFEGFNIAHAIPQSRIGLNHGPGRMPRPAGSDGVLSLRPLRRLLDPPEP